MDFCNQRDTLKKQQPEQLGLRSVGTEHSLVICSTLGPQARQTGIWDLPQSSFQTCWCWVLWWTLQGSPSQETSPSRHMEAAWLGSFAVYVGHLNCLLWAEILYVTSRLKRLIISGRLSSSLLPGRSDLETMLRWQYPMSWIPEWLGGAESSTGPCWRCSISKK